jgi:hypothetical protein
MHIKVPMTAELYTKLIEDAGRHLRSTDLHIIYLLREAMGLEFPLTKEWPARAANSAGRGAPTDKGILNDDAHR